MEKLWTIMSYVLPFLVGSVAGLIGWLLVTDKTIDFTLFFTILFYSFPAYMLLIAPCYILLNSAILKFQLRLVGALSLALAFACVQTVIAGEFLRVQVTGYLYLFEIFVLASCTFILCITYVKKSFI